MKESYREGVANHPGPEPCEGDRKVALEALDRGIRRQDIELRNRWFRVPTSSDQAEGNTEADAQASPHSTRRSRRPQACGETPRARTGRPHDRPSEATTAGRKENAMSGKSFMYGHGESYRGIVPAKQPNKGG
jgi:hypothetical protein